MRYIYIAGPYTSGDVALNVRAVIDAADAIWRAGFVPFAPHLCHFWHLVHPGSYEQWIAWDLAWLERCDAVIRLPGDSPGADREVQAAKARGLPVFYGLDDFAINGPLGLGWRGSSLPLKGEEKTVTG